MMVGITASFEKPPPKLRISVNKYNDMIEADNEIASKSAAATSFILLII